MHPVQVSKGRDGKTPFETLHGKKPTQEFVPFGEKVLARKNHHRSDEQEEPQISIRSLAWNAKQHCRVFHRECRRCVQSSQKQLTMGLGFRGE